MSVKNPQALVDPLRLHVFVAAALSVALSWQEQRRLPVSGLDNSWQYALCTFFIDDARWGGDAAFLYGPLGFLLVPMGSSTVLFALQVLVRGLVVAWIVLGARSILRLAGHHSCSLGVAITVLLCSSLTFTPELFFGALVLQVGRMRWSARQGSMGAHGVVSGAACSFLLLAKFNLGVAAALLFLCSLIGLVAEGKISLRLAMIHLATMFSGVPVWWVVSRQRFGDLPSFARESWEIASGFSLNMVFSDIDHRWSTPVILACPFIALTALSGSQRIRPRTVAFTELLALAAVGYFAMRSATVRQDSAHTLFIAGLLAFASLSVLPMSVDVYPTNAEAPAEQRDFVRRLVPFGLLVAASWTLQGSSMLGVADLPRAVRSLAVDVAFLTDDTFRAHRREQVRADLSLEAKPALDLLARNVPPSIGGSVDFLPHDANFASLASRPWSHAPIFQRYVSYTPRLDGRNADFYASASATKFLVSRTDAAIDFRSPLLESPRTLKSIFCNYQTVDRAEGWVLSKRVDGRSCAESRVALPGRTCVVLEKYDREHPSIQRRLLGVLWRPDIPLLEVPDSRLPRITQATFGSDVIVGGSAPGQSIGGVSLPYLERGKHFLCARE